MGSYRLARRAESDLEDIWDYTENTWSVEQAEKYLDGLFSCFQAIADGKASCIFDLQRDLSFPSGINHETIGNKVRQLFHSKIS